MAASSPIVLLDANTLYPAPVRDLLLHLADAKLYQPKWTTQIHKEWVRNLLINRPDLDKSALDKTVSAMNAAFPDATITRYHSLIDQLILPDEDDRHVLAAAVKAGADQIVTFNIKDFPAKELKEYAIQAIHPDDFVVAWIHLDKRTVEIAFEKMVAKLKKPPKTSAEVLDMLTKCGLEQTALLLRS